ncbi:SAF domain-containing protein [Actinomyces vulturis]|uniref:SAF domain-containing protein n=1 Tax=Actinomyces vulturis TaxID=1857645 RepID=UPI000830E43D|nr:SAF domain-containing protein [Actinomyces vulturis]
MMLVPHRGTHVWVLRHDVEAGQTLSPDDLTLKQVEPNSLPASGLADESIIGQQIRIGLPRGTVLTSSMTSANPAADLLPGERLISVHVDGGAQLAQPGLFVDISGPLPEENDGDYGLLTHHARIVSVDKPESEKSLPSISKTNVTLISLAVSVSDASLVYRAASIGSLSIMVSAS